MNKKIGVLGGIGPEASAIFYDKLIKKLQNLKYIKSNKDYPQIIINSIPAPELIHETIKSYELEPYIKGIKELEYFGSDFIVMVCNTIHLYYDCLSTKVNIPIIDLQKEVKNELSENNIKSILIIGTPSTIRKGLYCFDGIDCILPKDSEIEMLENIIFNFNNGIEKETQIKELKSLCNKYLSCGAERVLLGCTEFAAMLKDDYEIPKIDTIDVLVNAAIKKIK